MTEQEWRARYAARVVEIAKVPDDEAKQLAQNVELDGWYDLETDSPEDAADDELECWHD